MPATVTNILSGRRGRPKKEVDVNMLQEAFKASRSIRISTLAKKLKISRNTLKRNMQEKGVTCDYSDLDQDMLDENTRLFWESQPDSGYRYLHGYLRSQGLRIRRKDVQAAMHRVRPLAANPTRPWANPEEGLLGQATKCSVACGWPP